MWFKIKDNNDYSRRKIIKYNYIKILFFFFACELIACSDETIPQGEKTSPELIISPTKLEFSCDNTNSYKVDVITKVSSWTLGDIVYQDDASEQWVNIEEHSDYFRVSLTPNNHQYSRSATVSVYTGTESTELIIWQAATSFVWNTLGKGHWLDGYWYGFWEEVTIQQLSNNPSVYRITNPYTNELVTKYGNKPGTYTDYFTFKLLDDGTVSWDNFYINTLCPEYGKEIIGYYPAERDGLLIYNKIEKDKDGNILYFKINPIWLFDNTSEFNLDNPCYLVFPNIDFAKVMLTHGDYREKKWRWDSYVSGAVWGNMGYCGGAGSAVGQHGEGQWWGVTSTDEFNGQLGHTEDGTNHGDGDLNAYMVFSEDGILKAYDAAGNVIRSDAFAVEGYNPAGEWKVGELVTKAILWPYEINSGGNIPGRYEIVYLTPDKMTLVYPDGGDFGSLGSWGEASFWHFYSNPLFW